MTDEAFTLTASELELLGMICEDWIAFRLTWPGLPDTEALARELAKRITNSCAGVA